MALTQAIREHPDQDVERWLMVATRGSLLWKRTKRHSSINHFPFLDFPELPGLIVLLLKLDAAKKP